MYTIRKLTRDAILIASVIGALLILFSLQVLLSKPFLTGDAIQIGKQEPAVIIATPPTPSAVQQPPTPKMQCWLNRGLRAEDLSIVGSLLQQTTCTTAVSAQPVQAKIEAGCVAIYVGDSAATRLCLEDQQPDFSVDLSTPATTPTIIPPVKHNYWLAFFIFLAGIFILFVWGRADLRGDYYRRRSSQDFTRLLPGQAEVQIRYIQPPPAYIKHHREPAPRLIVHVQPAATSPVKPAPAPKEEQKVLSSPMNKILIKFNTLSQSLCDLIALKKFTAAEQQYPELYHLALTLYPQVSDENKARLMRVVTSLHEQLQALRKAYAVTQNVRDIYQREEQHAAQPALVWKPATFELKREQLHHLDAELTKLREKLHQTPKKQPHK